MRKRKIILLLLFNMAAIPVQALGYTEYLGGHRMKFPVVGEGLPALLTLASEEMDAVDAVEPVADALAALLAQRKVWQGQQRYVTAPTYTLQAYLGNKRSRAEITLQRLQRYIPDCQPAISYQLSRYIVFAGHFLTYVEAYRYHARLRKKNESVIIRPMPTLNQPDQITTHVVAENNVLIDCDTE